MAHQNLEEEIENELNLEKHKEEIHQRLELLDKKTPLTKLDLLKMGAYNCRTDDFNLYIVKVCGDCFVFEEDDNLYYKW